MSFNSVLNARIIMGSNAHFRKITLALELQARRPVNKVLKYSR